MLMISFLVRSLAMFTVAPFSLLAGSCQGDPVTGEEKVIYYRLGETEIPIHVTDFGKQADIVCINLHDNESTSYEAARNVLPSVGGLLIRIANREKRMVKFRFHGRSYEFDLNRMFSRVGIEASLRENGPWDSLAVGEVEKFATRVLNLVPSQTTSIIALHNNTHGGFSTHSYRAGGDRQKDAKEVTYIKAEDPDNFMLFTNPTLYHQMKDSGYNLILQDNENAEKDGSLSVWCGENGRNYINIETEHGVREAYEEMLRALLSVLLF